MSQRAEGIADAAVRPITDEELAFYEQHGWVKLQGLISRALAAQLLAAGKKLKETVQHGPDTSPPKETKEGMRHIRQTAEWTGYWTDYRSGAQFFQVRKIRIDPFLSFTLSKSLGRAMHRLMNRSSLTDDAVGVRYLEDALLCKESLGPGGGNVVHYHQDHLTFGVDRVGAFNLWVALDEVRPEQGAMRFLDESHLAGPLGAPDTDMLGRYPKLTQRYAWAPPLHYQPGDATIHHQLLVHGSPENSTIHPRWSYACTYMPADCILNTQDLHIGYPEPHERFPMVYP